MSERTIPISKPGPGDFSGLIYPDRDPPIAAWYEFDGDADVDDIARVIGETLGRPVKIEFNGPGGNGHYSAKVLFLDTKDETQEP